MRNSRFNRSRWVRCGFVLILSALALADVATAGQAADASIIGQVRDESGAALPGVTVTATSPSLQLPALTVVTDGRGEYRLSPLPIGTYTVVYELAAFQSVRQEGVRLTVGFTARLDVALKVGALEETVTVSGVSPVVDVTTATATLLTTEALQALPGNRNGIISLLAMAPGVRTYFDVAGTTAILSPAQRVFGQNGEAWTTIEGVATTDMKDSGGAGNYFDYDAVEEARVQTVGSSAEFPTRGPQLNIVLKSGGNTLHGSGSGAYTSERFQSDNIDDALAAKGITRGAPIQRQDDYGGDIGGRIVRDKLWFYFAGRSRGSIQTNLGAFNPDGEPAFTESLMRLHTEKLSWQMSPSNKLIGFFAYTNKFQDDGATQFVAHTTRSVETTLVKTYKGEWQHVRGAMMASVQFGEWGSRSSYPALSDQVPRLDLVTLKTSGLRSGALKPQGNNRKHTRATLEWYKPDSFYGNHDVKVGFEYGASFYIRKQLPRQYNHELLFRSEVPFQLRVLNGPAEQFDSLNSTGIFVQDRWTIKRRLTLALGARFTRGDGFVPELCRTSADPPGQLAFPASCYPRQQMAIWNNLAPRLHASYDISGDGKTVIKGGYGRFDHMRHLGNEVLRLDQNQIATAVYRWNDLNGNLNYDPGEVNLDPNGPDFVSTSQGARAIANPDEKQPRSHELSASLERELRPSLAIRLTGIYSRYVDLQRLQNNKRPYETYNIPVTNQDPGPDGRVGTADDPGKAMTYYEYSPALAGKAFEEFMIVNGTHYDSFSSVEVMGFKRLSNRWQFQASYSATKTNMPVFFQSGQGRGFNANWESGPLDPNAEINLVNRNWEWLGKISGGYSFPAGVWVSTNFEHRSGDPYARQVLFSGGRTIPTLVVNAEPIGTRRLPNLNLLDFRAEKSFSFRAQKLSLRLNVYNALNLNPVTALTVRSGPSFELPSAIMPPRILELAMKYTF